MYLNVLINDRVNLKVSTVSLAALSNKSKSSVAGVIVAGEVQIARIENEGDTQAARLVVYSDAAEDSAGEAEASELTANSWSEAPVDTDVLQYTWDPVNNVITSAPIVNARSAYHWQEKAKLSGAGLTFQGTWDSVSCSEPPTPTPDPGVLANGFFYIVTSVTGDTTSCPNLSVGDWLVWSGDLVGDALVEGSWEAVNWKYSWEAITGVTVEGANPAEGQDLAEFGTSYTKLQGEVIVARGKIHNTGNIQGSFNIATVTTDIPGEYVCTFTNPMPNIGYSILVTPWGDGDLPNYIKCDETRTVNSFTVKNYVDSILASGSFDGLVTGNVV